jgi:23S rRNA pseudouridine2605 synthase
MPNRDQPPQQDRRHGLARVLSKMGVASRTVAAGWVAKGRVAVNGRVQFDPDHPTLQGRDRIAVDGCEVAAKERVCLMLNKPRGLVTTTRDEHGRDTVYRCLDDASLPLLMPVGRLDKASEGLLLFCNDPEWAARITNPASGPDKTYHVQIDCLPDDALLQRLVVGIDGDGDRLYAKLATVLRHGARNAWLEIVLDEGRNREIRRLLAAQQVAVLRLLRVAIGSLQLGELPKGRWRLLAEAEINALAPPAPMR